MKISHHSLSLSTFYPWKNRSPMIRWPGQCVKRKQAEIRTVGDPLQPKVMLFQAGEVVLAPAPFVVIDIQ